MRLFFSLIVIVLLSGPSALFAQTKEIISEGTYSMGDGETPSVAESRALLKAKQIALEQAGTYVESYSKVKNITLTQDEIQVLASGLMEVEILDKKRTVVGDGINFWVKIKAKVSPDKMEEMAKRVKERSFVDDYKRIQDAYAKSQKEIEELKKQLAEAQDEKKKKIVEKIKDEERLYQANEWFNKGYQHAIKKEYDTAIESFTSAITLKPDYAEAYIFRGVAYAAKGEKMNNYDKVLDDFNKAIALDPNNAKAYTWRGFAYADKAQYEKAIKDFNQAITIDTNFALAYFGRGIAYTEKVSLRSYLTRETPRKMAFHYVEQDAEGHRNIIDKNQYEKVLNRAIKDFDKASSIEPYNAQAYTQRGWAYSMLGMRDKAIADYEKACNMGDKEGCNQQTREDESKKVRIDPLAEKLRRIFGY